MTHTPYNDAPTIFILGMVWCSGKCSDWLHRGKSCLDSTPYGNHRRNHRRSPVQCPIVASLAWIQTSLRDSFLKTPRSNPNPNPNPSTKNKLIELVLVIANFFNLTLTLTLTRILTLMLISTLTLILMLTLTLSLTLFRDKVEEHDSKNAHLLAVYSGAGRFTQECWLG